MQSIRHRSRCLSGYSVNVFLKTSALLVSMLERAECGGEGGVTLNFARERTPGAPGPPRPHRGPAVGQGRRRPRPRVQEGAALRPGGCRVVWCLALCWQVRFPGGFALEPRDEQPFCLGVGGRWRIFCFVNVCWGFLPCFRTSFVGGVRKGPLGIHRYHGGNLLCWNRTHGKNILTFKKSLLGPLPPMFPPPPGGPGRPPRRGGMCGSLCSPPPAFQKCAGQLPTA